MENLDNTAGIRDIWRVNEHSRASSIDAILERDRPRRKLQILSLTSRLSFKEEGPLAHYIAQGVSIKLLLLDPRVEGSLAKLEDSTTIPDQATSLSLMQTIAKLNQISNTAANVSIRFFKQLLPENLILIDDKLFLFSSLPATTSTRLIYQIDKGPESLYNLYLTSFEYIWKTSVPWPSPATN